MIVNLRGSGGSGKSTVGHALVAKAVDELILPPGHRFNPNKGPRLTGYVLPDSLLVLGRYTAKCGGLEGYEANMSRELVRRAAEVYRHVFFEGYFISCSCKPWIKLAEDMGVPFTILVMNTPFDECIRRIKVRNGGKVINEEAQRGAFESIHRSFAKFEASPAVTARYVDYNHAVEGVVQTFQAAGWEGWS